MRDYANRVAEIIREKSDTFDAEVMEVVKLNDETLIGVQLKKEGVNTSPVVYVDDFYSNGIGVEECADELIKLATSGDNVALIDSVGSKTPTWDEVKDAIAMRLVNTEYNKKYLADKVHKELDNGFSIMFDIRRDEYGVAITDKFAETLGCDELSLICASQISEVGKPTLYDMAEKLFVDEPRDFLAEDEPSHSSMLVLSTKDGTYGASAIYRGVGDKIKELVGEYYLLPSSVHEWIVVPESSGIAVEELCRMVSEANRTVVDRKDLLSYGVYKWRNNRLEKVA